MLLVAIPQCNNLFQNLFVNPLNYIYIYIYVFN